MTDTPLDEYRDAAREWLAAADIPAVPEDFNARVQVLREWQKTLYDAGWVGIHWPSEFGGQGLSILHSLAFSKELVRARAPHPIGLIGLDVVGPTIAAFGNDEQRARYLPSLLSGEELWCQGFSEPEAGSDLASIRTRGIVRGDELIVTGQKIWTSWAAEADWCACLVRTDADVPKHKGISYVLIDMRSDGISVRPIEQLTGDAEFNEVFFDEVAVPVANVLGEFGDGWRLALDTLSHERGGYAIRRRTENEVAFIDLLHALRTSCDPIPEHMARRVGEVFVALKAFEAQGKRTADRLAREEVPSPLDSVDKLLLAETEQQIYGFASELLGASRMAADARPLGLDPGRWTRGHLYARSASVYGGSSEIQRSLVAERLLGLPRAR
jgi:alkylation response protein AidB-like acyl-CoA dehydrogenase